MNNNGTDDFDKSNENQPLPVLSRSSRRDEKGKKPRAEKKESSSETPKRGDQSKVRPAKGRNTKTLIIVFVVIILIVAVIALEITFFLPRIQQMKPAETPAATVPVMPTRNPDDLESSTSTMWNPDIGGLGYIAENISEYTGSNDNIEIHYIDFERAKKNDSNIYAWIYLKNSVVSSPVVDYDDKFPSHVNPLKTSTFGSIYALKDSRNSKDFKDTNTIIYGKYTESSMFSGLLQYTQVEFYNLNPVIMLYTKKDIFALEVFSVYESVSFGDYNPVNFQDEKEYFYYIQNITDKSLIKTWVEVTSKDKIVTFVIDQDNLSNAMLIVHAKTTKVNTKNAQAG